jgi:phosphohistidine phosphatase
MRIILFRHGPAGKRDAERWPDDGQRPLTARGTERSTLAARGLVRLEPGITSVLTSPLARAKQTAELLAEAIGSGVRIEFLDGLAPGQSPRAVLQRLARFDAAESAVLVGHEPDLGQLAGLLLFEAPATLPLKKAGACAIGFEERARPGRGTLEWLVPPRILRRQACKVKR